jgi:hypothetical protein
MTGKLTVGTIQDTDGNTVTSTYVTNGVAKSYVHFDQDTSGVVRGSLNVSSVTDTTAGEFIVTYTSNFSDGYYSAPACNALKHMQIRYGSGYGPTTSKIDFLASDGANTNYDYYHNCAAIYGDLA